jgi:RNA polymerase sigma-70 factor, ECF subfamily
LIKTTVLGRPETVFQAPANDTDLSSGLKPGVGNQENAIMLGVKFAKAQQEITSFGLQALGLSIPKIKPAFEPARTLPRERCDAGHKGTHSMQEITGLLRSWHDGDSQALNRLMPLVHDELRRQARHYMQRERRDHLLQTTALVNQAFIKLLDAKNIDWRDRTHFFAISATLMRRVLVDFARSRGYQKRGPAFRRVDLSEKVPAPLDRNLVALDDALSALFEADSQKAKIVELKFFGGLTIAEIAKELKISPDRVKREWSLAKRWLFCEMRGRESHESQTQAED